MKALLFIFFPDMKTVDNSNAATTTMQIMPIIRVCSYLLIYSSSLSGFSDNDRNQSSIQLCILSLICYIYPRFFSPEKLITNDSPPSEPPVTPKIDATVAERAFSGKAYPVDSAAINIL